MRDHFLSFVILTFVCTPIVNAEDRIDLNADELNRIDKILKPATQFNKAEKYEIRSGGSGTYNGNYDANSYSHNLSTLSDEEEANFKVGNGLFRRLWVASPASTAASDGLGPYFDERACQSCHIKDGRGSVEKARLHSSLIVRLNREDANAIHGQQLQRRAIAGLSAEVDIKTSYEVSEVALNGGQIVELRQPVYTITDPRTGARIYEGDDVSVRMANPIYGVGLLEAIHPADIIANQDPDDSDGDGISGRINWQTDRRNNKQVGRFGWKADVVDLELQTATAFSADMGLSTSIITNPYGDCTTAQLDCLSLPHGAEDRFDAHEVSEQMVSLIVDYMASLAVPARRDVDDPSVLRGKQVFYNGNCHSCHVPKYVTSKNAHMDKNAFELIWPYTDMLLHDMGDGLADRGAGGSNLDREWRTPALWGIGLTKIVNPNAGYLHDGRARNLLEAILWHGGEAEVSKNYVVQLEPELREDLISFLRSL